VAFLTTGQPSMFEPNTDYTWAWKPTLSAQKPEARGAPIALALRPE